MATLQQIESFAEFAREQLAKGCDLSISELSYFWELRHRPDDVRAEDIAAIQFALDELKRGAPTRDVDELLEELRVELGLPIES